MDLQKISTAYLLVRNHDHALTYLTLSEDIALALDDKENQACVLVAVTNIYRQTDLPKAIEHAARAVEIFQKMGNMYGESLALSVLGRCYQEDGQLNLAGTHTEKGLEIAKQVGYPNLVGQLYVNLSNVRFSQGRYEESEVLAELAKEQDTANIEIRHNVLYNHIRNNMHLGNLKQAEGYVDEYFESVQQFASSEYQSTLSQLEAKYGAEKQEIQIGALKKERSLYLWLGITAALILLIALAYAFLRYRFAVNKRKLAEKENQRM